MTRTQTLVVKLRRPHSAQPWGIRIAGGADLNAPIVVTRSENEGLQRGDVIKKIDEYDARDLRHVDAQNLLQNSQSIRLVIERSEPSRSRTPRTDNIFITKSPPPPPTSFFERSVIGERAAVPSLSKQQRTYPQQLPKSPVPPPTPIDDDNRPFSPSQYNQPHPHIDEIREEKTILSQPYRTTPLVLPGAKVKKDAPIGECYLRHHPNPMIRAAPHHYEAPHPEVAMKQKVAETVLHRVLGPNEVPKVVHKQFNSPIGLYSEQNIADTIKCQASAVPLKPAMKYDPSKSEAYKALQEEAMGDNIQEVTQPARTGVFSPQRNQNRAYNRPPKSPTYTITYDDDEKIHQSNSFKRIMYSVLGQTDY